MVKRNDGGGMLRNGKEIERADDNPFKLNERENTEMKREEQEEWHGGRDDWLFSKRKKNFFKSWKNI